MSATEFDEGRLRFRFEQHVCAFQYDELAFYRNQFISVAGGGNKAVDFVCADGSTVYLIEVKDYIGAARNGGDLRVILHIEQARTRSRLNPHVFKYRDLEQKLKQLLKAVDPHPEVVSRESQKQEHPWKVSPLSNVK